MTSLIATQNSNSAADQFEERIGHRLRDDEREDDAQQHRHAGAEHHAPQPLPRRQRHAGHGDDDGVVAGQDDVDADDLERSDPERDSHQVVEQKFHRCPLLLFFIAATRADRLSAVFLRPEKAKADRATRARRACAIRRHAA